MKKSMIMGLCLLATAPAFGQLSLVKEADRALGGAKTYGEFTQAVAMLKPAFTNPETEKEAATYAAPAKAAYKLFDRIFAEKQFGKDVNLVDMSNVLMEGYGFAMKALDYDSVPDAKGKIKAKFSKDLVSQICGHANDYQNAGAIYWEAKDFARAYDAFTTYLDVVGNPRFGKLAPAQIPDSARAQIDLFAAYAAMNCDKLPQALQSFDNMVALGGISDPQAYDFAYNAAFQNNKDFPRMVKYLEQAVSRFGQTQPRFMEFLVNVHIDNKDYDKAKKLLDDAIAANPDDSGYYFSQGFLYQTMNDNDNAKASYKKAIQLDAKNARALFYYGNLLAQEFDALDQSATEKMSTAEYNKYFATTLTPILQEVRDNCEAAYAADPDNMDNALRILRTVYYRLGDDQNLKRVEGLLL